MTTPYPRSGTASGHRFRSPKGAQAPTHQVGRPTGESSTLVNVQLPLSLLAQLDRYIERLASQTGGKVNRGMIARRALELLLERNEAVGPQSMGSPPLGERDTFHRTSYHLSTPICHIFTPSARPAHDESGWHHSTCDDATWLSGYAAVDRQYCVRPGHAAVPAPATPHTRC